MGSRLAKRLLCAGLASLLLAPLRSFGRDRVVGGASY